jgi:carboxypeptidase PM20D1
MRRLLLAITALAVLLLAVLLLRAAAMPSYQIPVGAPPPSRVDGAGAVERLRAGLRIPTISHQDGADRDDAAFDALRMHLEQSYPGVHATLVREHVGAHSLLYRWAGHDPAAPSVVLLAHLDVVPVDPVTESEWTHPPFAAEVADGYLWGRGALDDKASLFAVLESVEGLVAEGFVPDADVYLAFGHDEELGGDEGAGAIADRLAARGARVGLVLDEGGSILDGAIVGLDRDVAVIGVAEKGYLSVELVAAGDGGHSSAPMPPTNIGRLASAVARLEAEPLPSRLDESVRAFFERGVGPESPFAFRIVWANLWLFDPLVRAALATVPGASAMIRTTTAPTIFRAGLKDNVLPARARAVVNFRVLPGDTTDGVIEHVRRVVDDPEVAVRALPKRREPTRASRIDGPGWEAVARTVREVFPGTVVAPYLMVAGTDSRHFRDLCDCVYQFVPFRVEVADMKRAHGTDERIPVAAVPDAVRFYRRLIGNVAGAPAERSP